MGANGGTPGSSWRRWAAGALVLVVAGGGPRLDGEELQKEERSRQEGERRVRKKRGRVGTGSFLRRQQPAAGAASAIAAASSLLRCLPFPEPAGEAAEQRTQAPPGGCPQGSIHHASAQARAYYGAGRGGVTAARALSRKLFAAFLDGGSPVQGTTIAAAPAVSFSLPFATSFLPPFGLAAAAAPFSSCSASSSSSSS